jgi:alcohol dehydrogenase
MKALVYHGPGERRWETFSDPEIQAPTDVVMRVDAGTICGTDLQRGDGRVRRIR